MKQKAIVATARAIRLPSVNLGVLQQELESATKAYKRDEGVLKRAQDTFDKSEQAYVTATKTLEAGVKAVTATNKVL